MYRGRTKVDVIRIDQKGKTEGSVSKDEGESKLRIPSRIALDNLPEKLHIKVEGDVPVLRKKIQPPPVLSQPLSVKSATKLQEFKRAASGIKHGKDLVYNLRHGISQAKVGQIKETPNASKRFLNVTEIHALKNPLLRSKSNPKGVALQHTNIMFGYVADPARVSNSRETHAKSMYRSNTRTHYRGQEEDWMARANNESRNGKVGVLEQGSRKSHKSNLTEIYGDTSGDWKKLVRKTSKSKCRNVDLSHSQCVNISHVLREGEVQRDCNTETAGRHAKIEVAAPALLAGVKKSKKSTKYTTDDSCKYTLEENIEEMHMAFVSHFQKIKQMLRRVETGTHLDTEDVPEESQDSEEFPSVNAKT